MPEVVGPDGSITPLCVVCRTELPPDPVHCPRCETPHHQDCWDYNGGCAVFGCTVSKDRPPPSAPLPAWPPRERALGAVFGGVMGFALVAGTLGHLGFSGHHGGSMPAGFGLGACGAITGALTGACVRARRDRTAILMWGLFGPGFGAWLLLMAGCGFARPHELPAVLAALIPMLMFGMVCAPASIPAAYLVARFNDPDEKRPKRQRSWLLIAAALAFLVADSLLRSY